MNESIRMYHVKELTRGEHIPITVFDIDNVVAFTLGNQEVLRSSGKWKIACMAGESRSVQWSEFLNHIGIDVALGGGLNFELAQNLNRYIEEGVRNFVFFATNKNIPLPKLIKLIEFHHQDIDPETLQKIKVYIVQADEGEVLSALDEIETALASPQNSAVRQLIEAKALDMNTGTFFDYRID